MFSFICFKAILFKKVIKVLLALEINTGTYFIHEVVLSFLKYDPIFVSVISWLNSCLLSI